MSKLSGFFKHYHLPILSGIFVGTSFIPFPPWALAFCYVPLWLWIFTKSPSLKQIFWGSWLTQFVYTMIGFHWIAYTAHEFGNMPWVAAVPILILFAAVMHVYVAVAHWLTFKLQKRFALNFGATLLLLTSMLIVAEMYWPSIFQWNLGYPLLWIHSPLAQWSDTIGFQGISFVILLLNALITYLWVKKDRLLTAGAAIATLAALLLLYFGGVAKAKYWSQSDSQIRVLQVQANIGNLERRYAERGVGFQQSILDDYIRLTQEGLAKFPAAELIVWPESAFPDLLNPWAQDRKYPSQLVEFVKGIQKPLFTGAYSKDPPDPNIKKRRDYNAVFLLGPQAELLSEPYHKTKLLIFGEYLPLVDTFPVLAKINPGGSGFGRGPGPSVMAFSDIRIGPQICYESLYPEFSMGLSRKGADLMINVTNDSWFGPRSEPYQHLYMTLARAVEIRRPLIRNTNTGVSSVILANGSVLEKSSLFQEWYGYYEIPLWKKAPQTIYAQFGAWLPVPILLIMVLAVVMGRRKK